TWVDVSGYSMGGFGTYRMLARWPDLFARGFSVVGAPGSAGDQLISIRNDPLLLWNATADELVNLRTSEQAVAADTAAGLQFQEGGGALPGGERPGLAYVSRSQSWGQTPTAPVQDGLVVNATNLATMTIDVARARVTCGVTLDVQTDGPLTIVLGGCGRTLQ